MALPSSNALASSQGPDRPLEVPAQSTEEYADGHMAMAMHSQFLCAHSRGYMAISLAISSYALASSQGPESTAVAVIPTPARLLLSVFSWWLTRGSVGNASRACNPGSAGCRMVVRRWQNSAAARLQRFVRRRWQLHGRYCVLCDMVLNGPSQYRDHCERSWKQMSRLKMHEAYRIFSTRSAAMQLSRA